MVAERCSGQSIAQRNIRVVFVSFFTLNFGFSLWFSLFPIYLHDTLHFTSVLIGTLLTVYSASSSVMSLPFGRLSDMIGRRVPLIAGSGILTLVTFLLYLLVHPVLLMILLIFYGVGIGLLIPAVNALIAESIQPGRSGVTFANYYISVLTATAFGAFLSGILANTWGYSVLFIIATFLLLSSFVTLFLFTRETMKIINIHFQDALEKSISSSVSGTFKLFKDQKDLAWLIIALSIHSFGFSMLLPYVPLYAELGVGLDLVQTGLIMSFWNVGLVVAQIPSGKMTDKFGGRFTLFMHVLLSTITWALYSFSFNFIFATIAILLFGAVGAMDYSARRTIMLEYSSPKVGKATIIGSLDSITGLVSIIAPLAGGTVWLINYKAPFIVASILNLFALFPLIILLKKKKANSL
jgi:MFS family permease